MSSPFPGFTPCDEHRTANIAILLMTFYLPVLQTINLDLACCTEIFGKNESRTRWARSVIKHVWQDDLITSGQTRSFRKNKLLFNMNTHGRHLRSLFWALVRIGCDCIASTGTWRSTIKTFQHHGALLTIVPHSVEMLHSWKIGG